MIGPLCLFPGAWTSDLPQCQLRLSRQTHLRNSDILLVLRVASDLYIIKHSSSHCRLAADDAVKNTYIFQRIRSSIYISSLPETSRCVSQPQGLVFTTRPLKFISGRYDITRTGRYTIVNCGDRNAARVVSLLGHIRTILRPTIRDVSLTYSSPAFRTFFSWGSNAPYVKQVLTNVTTGVSLYPPEQRFHQTGSPLLICATAAGQVIGNADPIDYYYECLLGPFKNLIPIKGTPYIVICPHFFSDRLLDSPPAHSCLTVDSSISRFLGTGYAFINFKIWALLDGILRYYMYATTTFGAGIATSVDRCVRLGGRQKVENPSNYLYYVASELSSPPDTNSAERRK